MIMMTAYMYEYENGLYIFMMTTYIYMIKMTAHYELKAQV